MQSPDGMVDGMLRSSGASRRVGSVEAKTLPVIVRVVRTPEQLKSVCEVRCEAYGRHLPEFGRALIEPEAADWAPGTVILMAQCKASGETIGTMRIHTNAYEPLPVQADVEIPEELSRHLLVEVCRFSIKPGFNQSLARLALFKALYLYCCASQVQHMVVTARRPLNRIYKSLGFAPLHGGVNEAWIPISYTGNLLHSVLTFNVLLASRQWCDIGHPLYDFMVCTYHPDIQVFAAVSSAWNAPRGLDISVQRPLPQAVGAC
jgi:hypothetical protein